jgi:hypothetical protein
MSRLLSACRLRRHCEFVVDFVHDCEFAQGANIAAQGANIA